MDHVVTVGMIVKPMLVILCGLAVLGGLAFILSVIASGWNH